MAPVSSTIHILLADNLALFSDGLALQLTQADPAVTVVGQVFRGVNVVPAVHQHTPHVGEKLFVGSETVKSHRKNIHRKLGITHLSELLDFAREHGL